MLILHEMLSFLLLYSCFCRAVRMNPETVMPVRLAFWALSIAAVLCVFAPLSFQWQPDLVSMVLLSAIVAVQVVTSTYWRNGIPMQFQGRPRDALRQ